MSSTNPLSWLGYYTVNYPGYYLYTQACDYMQPDESVGKNITKITQNLYICDWATSFNKELLKAHNITNVVVCVYGLSPRYPNDFKYKTIPLIDSPIEPIIDYFDETNKYIQEIINNGGNVLVHCMCGASRSVSIIAAYIIYKGRGNVKPEIALKYLRSKRKEVNPNTGYIEQLEEYYKRIKNENGQKDEQEEKMEIREEPID